MAAGHRLHISSKYTFEYQNIYKEACVTTDTLEFRLPNNGEDLSAYSIVLNNCLFGYAENIKKKLTVVYGVFKDNKLVYALEIHNEHIVQAVKRSNLPIGSHDYQLILEWFNTHLYSPVSLRCFE